MVNTDRNSLRIKSRSLRDKGYTWEKIGKELGVSRKVARKLYDEPESNHYPISALVNTLKDLDLYTELSMKVLVVDIETSPNIVEVWELWNQNINLNQLRESTEVICWAAKWLGKDEVEFKSVHHDNKEVLVKAMWDLLDEADVVVHFNGIRFDIPHLNREFVEMQLPPPSPYKQIDLYQTVKKQFKFPSNKLAYVSRALGLEGKVEHEGYGLWIKCLADDPEAWERMKNYNVRDVFLTEELYERLRPWIISHPNHGAVKGDGCCPACGKKNLKREGHTYTSTGKYQQYRCGNCSKWSRSSKRQGYTKIINVAL